VAAGVSRFDARVENPLAFPSQGLRVAGGAHFGRILVVTATEHRERASHQRNKKESA